MIGETLLVAWLIVCIFVPFLYAVTATPPAEVRRVTNALVRQRAEVIALEPHVRAVARRPVRAHAVGHDEPNRSVTLSSLLPHPLRV